MAIIFILLVLCFCLVKDILKNLTQTRHKQGKHQETEKKETSINFDSLDDLAEFVEEVENDNE